MNFRANGARSTSQLFQENPEAFGAPPQALLPARPEETPLLPGASRHRPLKSKIFQSWFPIPKPPRHLWVGEDVHE
jgi:hypothetical protein